MQPKLTVERYDGWDDNPLVALVNQGIEVFSSHSEVVRAFQVNVVDAEKLSHLGLEKGDFLLSILRSESLSHPRIRFASAALPNEELLGVIVMRCNVRNALAIADNERAVTDFLHETEVFLERWFNRQVFQTCIDFGDKRLLRGPFSSVEEAIENACAEFPQLCGQEPIFDLN